MAGGIDISDRKPRRLRGTPALKFSNRLAAVVLGASIFSAFLLNKISMVDLLREKYDYNILEVSETEYNRRKLFSFLKQNRSDEIKQLLAEQETMRNDF